MTLPTQNPGWGFYGTLRTAGHSDDQTTLLWMLASNAIRLETGCDEEAVRRFLDSKQGRHFADDVHCAISRADQNTTFAVQSTCDRWMGWRISRRTEHELGIPAGLPYLVGFVEHERIMAETEEN